MKAAPTWAMLVAKIDPDGKTAKPFLCSHQDHKPAPVYQITTGPHRGHRNCLKRLYSFIGLNVRRDTRTSEFISYDNPDERIKFEETWLDDVTRLLVIVEADPW